MKDIFDDHFKVIGHRGFPASVPENTLDSFKAAMNQGVDAVELDVQLTRDGYAVVFHDFTTGRLCEQDLKVTSSDLTALRKLKVNGTATIPTLQEVFKNIQEIGIFVELKVSASADRDYKLKLCKAVRKVVESNGARDRTVIISFDVEALRIYGELDRKARLGIDYDMESLGFLKNYGIALDDLTETFHILLPDANLHEKDKLKALADSGKKIFPWTVNDVQSALDLKSIGVSGIITDNAEIMVRSIRHL